jgi:hypothetical protein
VCRHHEIEVMIISETLISVSGCNYIGILDIQYLFRVRARKEEVFNRCLLIRPEWVISRSLTIQRLPNFYHTGPCNFQAVGGWEQF